MNKTIIDTIRENTDQDRITMITAPVSMRLSERIHAAAEAAQIKVFDVCCAALANKYEVISNDRIRQAAIVAQHDPGDEVMLLFDNALQAIPEIVNAIQRIAMTRVAGGRALPKNLHIVFAGRSVTDCNDIDPSGDISWSIIQMDRADI